MPARALIQLNESCNLRCAHCSQSAPHESIPSPLLDRDDVFALLKKLKQTGLQAVRFTGGDPFLYRSLEDVTRGAAAMGLRVSLITNGQVLAQWPEQRIDALGASEIIVSFYSPSAAEHERRCGLKGSFDQAWTAIEKLARTSVAPRIYLLLPVSEMNALSGFMARAADANVRSTKIMQVFAQGRATKWAAGERLANDDLSSVVAIVRAQRAISERMAVAINIFGDQMQTVASLGLSLPRDTGCHMGLLDEWTVSGRGEVLPCCLYLDRERRSVLSIDKEETFDQWKQWDRDRSVRWATSGEATSAKSLSWCPVLDPPEPASAFVCPLTFIEL